MKKMQGFTLVELMIVVGIVAILARLVYPSYQSSIRKTNRSDAINALLDASQKLERCFTSVGKYNDSTRNCRTTVVPSGKTSDKAYYDITIGNVAAATYTLTATAPFASRQYADTSCRTFTLTQAGVRGSTNSAGTAATTPVCW
jgi:type IV pilus assembly protein PilE